MNLTDTFQTDVSIIMVYSFLYQKLDWHITKYMHSW